MDNLCQRGITIVDWCCMCKASGESVDNLLLHCSLAGEWWTFHFHSL
jgi:hypothetical protein